MDFVSPRTGNVINVEWLDISEDSQRMISWLGFKKPCSEWVTTHFEEEILTQTPDAKILSIKLNAQPDLTSKWKRSEPSTSIATLSALTVRFPLVADVLKGQEHWQLVADLTCRYEGMGQGAIPCKKNLDFTVIKAVRI
jgi:hypothetical protein